MSIISKEVTLDIETYYETVCDTWCTGFQHILEIHCVAMQDTKKGPSGSRRLSTAQRSPSSKRSSPTSSNSRKQPSANSGRRGLEVMKRGVNVILHKSVTRADKMFLFYAEPDSDVLDHGPFGSIYWCKPGKRKMKVRNGIRLDRLLDVIKVRNDTLNLLCNACFFFVVWQACIFHQLFWRASFTFNAYFQKKKPQAKATDVFKHPDNSHISKKRVLSILSKENNADVEFLSEEAVEHWYIGLQLVLRKYGVGVTEEAPPTGGRRISAIQRVRKEKKNAPNDAIREKMDAREYMMENRNFTAYFNSASPYTKQINLFYVAPDTKDPLKHGPFGTLYWCKAGMRVENPANALPLHRLRDFICKVSLSCV